MGEREEHYTKQVKAVVPSSLQSCRLLPWVKGVTQAWEGPLETHWTAQSGLSQISPFPPPRPHWHYSTQNYPTQFQSQLLLSVSHTVANNSPVSWSIPLLHVQCTTADPGSLKDKKLYHQITDCSKAAQREWGLLDVALRSQGTTVITSL